MKIEIQLTLDSFACDGEPLCNGQPGLNGFKELCYFCSRSDRRNTDLVCTLFGSVIRSWDKYSLKEWKALRTHILTRDEHQCSLCGSSKGLHIHHVNRDKTDDSPENLLTLCGICHARVHTELRLPGGQDRVTRVLTFIHSRKGDEGMPDAVSLSQNRG